MTGQSDRIEDRPFGSHDEDRVVWDEAASIVSGQSDRDHERVEKGIDKLVVAAERIKWLDQRFGMTPDQQQMVRMVIRDLARVSDFDLTQGQP